MKYSDTASVQERNQNVIQQIADRTPNILYIYHLIEQRNIYVNRSFTYVVGYSRQEILQMGAEQVEKLWHPDDMERIHKHFQQCATLKDNEFLEIEFRIQDCKGEWHWLRSRNTVFSRTPKGTPREILGTAEDITHDKRSEQEQVLLTQATLQDTSHVKSSFLSTVSYDIRTQFNTLMSAIRCLEHSTCNQVEKQQLFAQIKDAVAYISHVLENELLVDCTESRELKFKATCFDALQLIHSLLKDLERLGIKNQIYINSDKYSYVELDKKLIHQILKKLLEIAITFSRENSPIRLNFKRFQGKAVFQIQTPGFSIPPEEISHLFECSSQTSDVGKMVGTGLGLAIVKLCVNLHRGQMSVNSVAGRGTIFTVTLPQEH